MLMYFSTNTGSLVGHFAPAGLEAFSWLIAFNEDRKMCMYYMHLGSIAYAQSARGTAALPRCIPICLGNYESLIHIGEFAGFDFTTCRNVRLRGTLRVI